MSKQCETTPNFWKEHQRILQHCTDLSKMCNVKILGLSSALTSTAKIGESGNVANSTRRQALQDDDSTGMSGLVESCGSTSNMKYKDLFARIQKQISSRTASRNKTCCDIQNVFDQYADPVTKVLSVEDVRRALHDLGCDNKEHINLLLTLGDKSKTELNINEFRRIVESPTSLEQIVRTFPVWKLISDAIPRKQTNEELAEDGLSMLASLTPEEVDCIVDAMTDELKVLLRGFCRNLKKQEEFRESSKVIGESKFSTDFYNAGGILQFHDGLDGRVGLPDLRFEEAMRNEHCIRDGCEFEFKTCNYQVETCPRNEWRIVVEHRTDLADMGHGRIVVDISQLMKLELVKNARLTRPEVIAVVLYTGPMFMVYNAILRRFPLDLFQTFRSNLFSTTIHVLVSAVQKVSRVMKLADGLRLYRGFSGKALPPSFYREDKHGVRGFAEWGFMSTTSDMSVAVKYSGSKEGRANAVVFVIPVGSVDRGACIQQLSQYPGEEEILWPPLSFIAPAGDPCVEDVGQGLVNMLQLRVNANLKARTVEELLGQKKQAHLTAFRQMQEELLFDLSRMTQEGFADLRMAADKVNPLSFTVDDLLGRILQQCQAVFERQRAIPSSEYAKDQVFRSLVTEMLETKAFARSKLLAWLEDDSLTADYMIGAVFGHGRMPPQSIVRPHARLAVVRPLTDWCSSSLRAMHRWRIGYWKKIAAGRRLPPTAAAAVRPHWASIVVRPDTLKLTPARAALEVCRMQGLLQESAVERNADGETALVSAMNDGASLGTLDLLLQAGADVNAFNDTGTTNLALCYAAERGDCTALAWLCCAGARLENRDKIGRTALIRAAGEGHSAAVEQLLAAGADLDAEDNNGMTATMFAARWGFVETVALLADRGAALRSANAYGRTALMEAAERGQSAVVEALAALGAEVALAAAGPDGVVRTALDWAERNHHTATADVLRALLGHGTGS